MTSQTDNKTSQADLKEQSGKEWIYSDTVKEHFFNPQNILMPGEEKDFDPDGMGYVGSPACGDMMKMWIKIDAQTDKITQCKWQTFGCASAIASTSVLSVMVTEDGGMPLDEAMQLHAVDILNRLGGLPDRKVHCSVLGDKALRQAINDYFKKSEQYSRVQVEGERMIDKVVKVTDEDIQQAVMNGATTFKQVQQQTKVGTGDPDCIPEAKQLVRYYTDKYYT